MAHIPCVHIISSDISRPHHFGTLGFEIVYTCTLYFSWMSKSQNFLPSGVHIVQLSTAKVVTCGMSRKGPHHYRQHHHAMPPMFFGFGPSGSSPFSSIRHKLRRSCEVRRTCRLTLMHLFLDLMDGKFGPSIA
jgi:hypothetical protein